MDVPGRGTAGRLTLEFVVIVAGVLVALVLESWWSDRAARRFEAELRQDMVEEFRENVSILRDDLETNATLIADVASFTGLPEDEFMSLPYTPFTEAVREAMGGATFDPAMGAVQALVSSGNVNAIRDRELRLLIARWAGLLTESARIGDAYNGALFATLYPRFFDYLADGVWTETERRATRELVVSNQGIASLEFDVQQRLLVAAQDILTYLGVSVD